MQARLPTPLKKPNRWCRRYRNQLKKAAFLWGRPDSRVKGYQSGSFAFRKVEKVRVVDLVVSGDTFRPDFNGTEVVWPKLVARIRADSFQQIQSVMEGEGNLGYVPMQGNAKKARFRDRTRSPTSMPLLFEPGGSGDVVFVRLPRQGQEHIDIKEEWPQSSSSRIRRTCADVSVGAVGSFLNIGNRVCGCSSSQGLVDSPAGSHFELPSEANPRKIRSETTLPKGLACCCASRLAPSYAC